MEKSETRRDGNSNKIAIQCRNPRETKKPEHFSRADGCNKLNSVLFSCIFTLLASKRNKYTLVLQQKKKRKKDKHRECN